MKQYIILLFLMVFSVTTYAQVSSPNTNARYNARRTSSKLVDAWMINPRNYSENSILVLKDTLGMDQFVPLVVDAPALSNYKTTAEGSFAISGDITAAAGADTINLFELASVNEHWSYGTTIRDVIYDSDTAALIISSLDSRYLVMSCQVSANADSILLDEVKLVTAPYMGGTETVVKSVTELSSTYEGKWVTQMVPVAGTVDGPLNAYITVQITNTGLQRTFSPFIECRYSYYRTSGTPF